jgi:hypothetical protein
LPIVEPTIGWPPALMPRPSGFTRSLVNTS